MFAGDDVEAAEAKPVAFGQVFAQVLEHCAVFADNEQGRAALARFVASVR